ncbi:FAD-dependent oxidoreductase [Streptomyces thinghirensis]|nr:FAD-dependent oxidoreductase [Streptomyces thinghirensis]
MSEGRGGPVVREQFTADVAVVTVPFSGLRHVQVEPPMSYGKRRAVCELHYDSATSTAGVPAPLVGEFDEADWKRELHAVDPGLYDAYRTGRAAADGSLLGAHPSVPAGHITPGQRTTTPPTARSRAISRRRSMSSEAVPLSDNANRFVFSTPPIRFPAARGRSPGLLQLGGRRAALGLPRTTRRGTPHALCGSAAAGSTASVWRSSTPSARPHAELAARPLRLR